MTKPFAVAVALALVPLVSPLALAAPQRLPLDHRPAGKLTTGAACSGGPVRCHVHVVTTADGDIIANDAPVGLGADDLQSAYDIVAANQQAGTVAIVDAYGYKDLESDLAKYRKQYNLPPCTVASGCLTIVNQTGQTTPLPRESPATPQDWTIETALDVQMASTGCPSCKILVVQATDDSGNNLFDALAEAASLAPSVVSNSWGLSETALTDITQAETFVGQFPGVAIFASTGDSGYDMGSGTPQYPSTSAHVIAVGGTEIAPASNARGWSEVAWSDAGSSCSVGVPKLATQATNTGCAMRAASDLSAAAGDPGIAIVNKGKFTTVEGTSASCPLVASMFAAAGLGSATPDSIPALASTFHDITTGTNGTCAGAMCTAGAGWDGPTGYGSPDAGQLGAGGGTESFTVTSPQAGQVVAPGFIVDMTVMGALDIVVALDGAQIGDQSSGYSFPTPAGIANGAHEIVVTATDAAGNSADVTIDFSVQGASGGGEQGGNGDQPPASGGDEAIGGCAAAGSGGGGAMVLVLGAALLRRRRRA